MTFWLMVLLLSMPALVETARDPLARGLPHGVKLRDLDCEHLSEHGARLALGVDTDEDHPRGDFLRRRTVLCRERLLPRGTRRAQDDAILGDLRATAGELASLAADRQPDAAGRTWLVETYYPDTQIAYKIGFAVKGALLERSLPVSDRVPTLAAGDVEVLGQVAPDRAYPLACARFAAAGALGPGEALLGVVLRDSRETVLHAGTCVDGRWSWLR